MKVIPPITITPAVSTVVEPATGETVWVSGHAYVAGDKVILAATHRRYECTVAITGTATPDLDAAHWRDDGPTNKYAMFDLTNSSQTEMVAAALVVDVTPGRRVNAILLRNLYGASAQIEVIVGGSPIHSETINLLLRHTTTWMQYYFGAFRVRKALVRFNLPMSSVATIRVTIQPTAGYARCGEIVLGMAEDMGTIVDEPTSDQLSLSKVERDDFGTVSLIKRRNVPQTSHRVRAPAARLDRLFELRSELDATPAVFSGADDNEESNFFDTLLVLGFARKWSISMRANAVMSDIQLEEL